MAESARNGKRAVSIPHPLTTLHPKLLERIAGDRIGNECKKLVCLSNILRYIEERPADWYVLEDDDDGHSGQRGTAAVRCASSGP